MVFNSIEFLIFFPLVVTGYYLIPHRYRWMLLLAGSYYFYMCWKLEYVFLILFSTMVDYFAGIMMERYEGKQHIRKMYLIMSLVVNLGLLFTFKYFNFFSDNLRYVFNAINVVYHAPSLNLLLPVGISFYTFQTLSYTIEVYKRNYKAEKHFGYFALYVAYFPQLVAGPIERPGNLLPQLRQKIHFSYQHVTDGLKMMAWGFFKKLVIADRCAILVDQAYAAPDGLYGWNIFIPSMLFYFQIYCDFSAYSDIAVGTARLMGVKLSVNFNRPYLANSFRSYWRRWHMTLTLWIKDYLFKPIISRVDHWGMTGKVFAVISSFTIIGLWHGASWGMVLFGFVNGLLVAAERVVWPWQKLLWRFLPEKVNDVLGGLTVFFAFIMISVVFRSNSVQDMMTIFSQMFLFGAQSFALLDGVNGYHFITVILFTGLVVLVESLQREKPFFSDWVNQLWFPVRWSIYVVLMLVILSFGIFSTKEYIYFQF
jgi:alginate O-acetyltransferase complex protein AlgI